MSPLLNDLLIPFFAVLFWGSLAIFLHEAGRQILPGRDDPERSRVLNLGALSTAILFFAVFASPYQASNCAVSDSVEYAVGAARFGVGADYSLPVGGGIYPPRYAPWFSMLILSPFHSLLGPELGVGIIPVLLFVLVMARAAFLIGFLLAGGIGGAAASLLLLGVPGMRYFSQQILTDVPATALTLCCALAFVLRARPDRPGMQRPEAVAGFLIGFAAALRPMLALLAIPFIAALVFEPVPRAAKLRRLLLLLAPLAIFGVLTLLYNAQTFGSALRTGYHFWVPAPYDSVGLTFALGNAAQNLVKVVVDSGVLFLGTAAAVLVMMVRARGTSSAAAADLTRFILRFGIPYLIVHLLYFYATLRFYLPVTALLGVTAGGLLGAAIGDRAPWRRAAVPIMAALWIGVLVVQLARTPAESAQRQAARRIASFCSRTGGVISAINPAYLAYLLPKSCGTVIPVSRRIEYASKVVAPRPLSDALPLSTPFDTLKSAAERSGGHPPFPRVAIEMLPQLEEAVRSGGSYLLETSQLTVSEREELRGAFQLVPLAGDLYRLGVKK